MFTWGPVSRHGDIDPYASNVVLLCHFNGDDLSTTVVDSSQYAASATLYYTGTEETQARIRTDDYKFGNSAWRHAYAESGGFNNRTVWFPSRAEYAMAGDFTIEFWIKKVDFYGGEFYVLNGRTGVMSAGSTPDWAVQMRSGGEYWFSASSLTIEGVSGAAIVAIGGLTGVWQHVAFARDGGTIRAFVDGDLKSTKTCSGSIAACDINLFGLRDDGLGIPNCWMQTDEKLDELRITVGTARYIASFTPPSSQFPDP